MAFRNITNIGASSKPLVAKTRKLIKKEKQMDDFKPQIRTSSPISSTTSDSFDAPPDGLFPPSHQARHLSIRELAYEKLRQQKTVENLQRFSSKESTNRHGDVKSNGKLKMLAYNNYGHMTVHVIKGKSYKIQGDTYVRINMLPDKDHFYKCSQTSLSKHSKRSDVTVYDEKISFELNQLCLHDRLCVSVWSKSSLSTGPYGNSVCSNTSSSTSSSSLNNVSKSSRDQLIGCFSFRIKSLMSSHDSAEPHWYHLLPESIGISKHFRCHRSKLASSNHLTEINKDLQGMEKVAIHITRKSENESYGFTVSGNCPCTIGKVDVTKQAYHNGLRPGDHISALKDINVSRATCDSVVKLIKSFKTSFDIEVYREKRNRPVIVSNKQINPMDNIYQEIQMVNNNNKPRERGFLEVVHEEEEDDDDEYEDSEYLLPAFENIRHVDSDINTEDERLEEHIYMIRQGSIKYMQNQARISSLRNLKIN